jgi:hypothetical protein
MSVKFSVISKKGKEHGPQTHGCFGPWYSKGKISSYFDIDTRSIKDLKFYPEPPDTYWITPHEILSYLRILERIGIRTVVEHEHPKLLYSTYRKGVSVDMTKHSGQAAIGALELIRNIRYRPLFCKLVVHLVRNGVEPETALYIPRFFVLDDQEIAKKLGVTLDENSLAKGSGFMPPNADTTGNSLDYLTVKGEKLFSKKTTERHSNYPAWTSFGSFDGVYNYYNGREKLTLPCCMYSYTRGKRTNDIRALNTMQPLSNTFQREALELLHRLYPKKLLKWHQLLKVAKHYQVTGELPTTLED